MGEKIPKDQRKRVMERDKNRCILCHRKYQLQIHHYYEFEGKLQKFQDVKSNSPYVYTRDCDLVTLCSSCHTKIHHIHDHSAPMYKMIGDYLSKFASPPLDIYVHKDGGA